MPIMLKFIENETEGAYWLKQRKGSSVTEDGTAESTSLFIDLCHPLNREGTPPYIILTKLPSDYEKIPP